MKFYLKFTYYSFFCTNRIDKKRVYKQFDDNNKQNLKEKHKIFPRCIANLYRTDVDNQVKRFVISYTDVGVKTILHIHKLLFIAIKKLFFL